MMYPRLVLLREFLREDGSIWVTIDDNEAHYLKVIMDEIFGRNNFITSITWMKRTSPANDAKYFSTDHDNILVFARKKQSWSPVKVKRGAAQDAFYKNPDKDLRGAWNSVTYAGNKTPKERPNLYYPIINPNTKQEVFPTMGLTWRYSLDHHQDNEKKSLLYWGKDGKSRVPRLKMFLMDAKDLVPRTVWHYSEVGSTQASMTEQKIMFGEPFATPKPESLIERMVGISTHSNDLILDSFLGSGTTAAVAHK